MPSDHGDRDDDSWKNAISELKDQQILIRTPNLQHPGYVRQKQAGKLWVRERLKVLLDKDSFVEVGSITGEPIQDQNTGKLKGFLPANSIMGSGKISGRTVYVTADDFTVRGGHADGGIQRKTEYAEIQARRARVPLIRLLDGSSGGGSVATYLAIGHTYIPALAVLWHGMDAMAVVPAVSALLGPVVGLAAAKTVVSHFSVMVRGVSQLFAAGPPVVKQATFEDLTKEQLGGADVHAVNGTVDNVASSELDAFEQIRSFLSFLPSSIFSLPPVQASNDPESRKEEDLISIIPRRRARSYDIRRLIKLVVDNEGASGTQSPEVNVKDDSFFEIGSTWGKCIVTGFASSPDDQLACCLVTALREGVLSMLWEVRKQQGSLDFAITSVDQPGFAVGSLAERTATIRHGVSAIAALYQASVPIYTVIIRRVFGVAGGAFGNPDEGHGVRVAWPSGDWGSLPLEGGIEAAYRRQLDAAETPEARDILMQELLAKFENVRNPLKTAYKFGVEEIIDPRDTRPLLCKWTAHVYENVLPQLVTFRQSQYGLDLKPTNGRGYKL